MLGTNKTDGPGQANHGILSQIFGKALGVGKPDGSAANPLYVTPTSGGLFGGKSGGLVGLFGANDNSPDWGGMSAGSTPDYSSGDFSGGFSDIMGKDGGSGFIQDLSGVFKENSSGGFVGALKSLFGGGTGGGGGGIGAWLSGNQGSIGAGLGALLATVAHDGLSPGSTSTGVTRVVDPRIFLSAPRLHGGLRPGEFPAILEEGEGVSSRRQVAQQRMGGSAPVNIYVSTPNSDSFRKSDRQIAGSLKRRLAVA